MELLATRGSLRLQSAYYFHRFLNLVINAISSAFGRPVNLDIRCDAIAFEAVSSPGEIAPYRKEGDVTVADFETFSAEQAARCSRCLLYTSPSPRDS